MPALRYWNGDLARPSVLVGEDNGGRPGNALYPDPPGSAGHRLCVKVFGMDPRQYLLAFLRYNLCTGKWDAEEAERRASGLNLLYRENLKILLGAKVARAFGFNTTPFYVIRFSEAARRGPILQLPTPRVGAGRGTRRARTSGLVARWRRWSVDDGQLLKNWAVQISPISGWLVLILEGYDRRDSCVYYSSSIELDMHYAMFLEYEATGG